MITVHHLEYSQSFRILWLLEELGADYELKLYARDKTTRLAPAEYKAVSPLGTAPVITDGDLALAESGAILEYIMDQYPDSPLRPGVGSPDRARHLFWFHAAQGSLMPVMLIDTLLSMIVKRSPFFISALLKPIFNLTKANFSKPRLKALLKKAESDLADQPWFGGEHLTIADIVLSYPMESAAQQGLFNESYPNCRAWVERMHERDAFKRAQEKDGKDSTVFKF